MVIWEKVVCFGQAAIPPATPNPHTQSALTLNYCTNQHFLVTSLPFAPPS